MPSVPVWQRGGGCRVESYSGNAHIHRPHFKKRLPSPFCIFISFTFKVLWEKLKYSIPIKPLSNGGGVDSEPSLPRSCCPASLHFCTGALSSFRRICLFCPSTLDMSLKGSLIVVEHYVKESMPGLETASPLVLHSFPPTGR